MLLPFDFQDYKPAFFPAFDKEHDLCYNFAILTSEVTHDENEPQSIFDICCIRGFVCFLLLRKRTWVVAGLTFICHRQRLKDHSLSRF